MNLRTKTLKLGTALMLATAVCGAQAWHPETSGTTAGLRGIHAVDPLVAWASGTGGTVMRSEDGGAHWYRCSTPPGADHLDFRGVWAWDARTALAMASGPGNQSRLFRTSDGCRNWKQIFSNPDAADPTYPGFWDGILFPDRQNGIIYGDPVAGPTRNQSGERELSLPLLVTQDGGLTWKPGKTLLPMAGESAFAASNSAMTANSGWIWLGTSKGRVLRSGPGVDWLSVQTPLASGNDSSGVFSLAFRDPEHGVAVGGDYKQPEDATATAAFTSDGGGHWHAAHKPPHGYRSVVAWDKKDRAWIAAGSNGTDISYDDGDTWQWLDGGNWNALSLPWIVGPRGQIGKLGTVPGRHGLHGRSIPLN